MRNDIEKAVVETVVAYASATLDQDFVAGIPVVAFYDPMAIDDADRIIVSCEIGETKQSGPSNAVVQVEVGVKTRLEQPDMADAISGHFVRVNAVRDIFNVSSLEDELHENAADGIAITNVEPVRRFGTTMSDGSAYSRLEMNVHCHTTEEA